jgi:hypothetical protein
MPEKTFSNKNILLCKHLNLLGMCFDQKLRVSNVADLPASINMWTFRILERPPEETWSFPKHEIHVFPFLIFYEQV